MICPRCNEKFFSRNYSTRAAQRNVKCPTCKHYFPAPMRVDLRRTIKDLLHDDLFDGVWRGLDVVGRVKWLVDKVKEIVKKE